MTETIQRLKQACQVLSSVCDGARVDDGMGFNKPDSVFGNWIAWVPNDQWTDQICAAVRDMLTKYGRQLEEHGITELPVVPRVHFHRAVVLEEIKRKAAQPIKDFQANQFKQGNINVDTLRESCPDAYIGIVEGDVFRMFSPRDRNLINDIKTIQPWQLRKWNRDQMCWEVTYQGLSKQQRLNLLKIIEHFDFIVSEKDMEELHKATPVEEVENMTDHILIKKDKIIFKTPYNAQAVQDIKACLQGRRWNPDHKYWTAPINPINVEKAAELARVWGWNLSAEFTETAKEILQKAEANIEASQAVQADLEIPGLDSAYDLYPFQKAGVEYALRAKKVIIGDEMGLGKTLQGSATVVAAQAFPCLVICPKAVKKQWQVEIKKFFPNQSASLVEKKTDWSANFVIINYDIVKKNLETLKSIDWKAIILDESHYIKNSKAQRSEAILELARTVEYKIALTGTPVLNKPAELISQINFLNHMETTFGGFWNFAKRYCNAYKGEHGWDLSGATNLDELAKVLRSACFVRREKKEVFQELPALQRTKISCTISAKAAKKFAASIKQTQEDMADWSDDSAKAQAQALVEIMRLKREAAQYKYDSGLEWIKNFLESGEKLVLFAHHRDLQEKLYEDLKAFNPAKITGGDTGKKREANVEKFWKDDSCKVIVCSLKAANVGLNLQVASNVAFFEFAWHSGDMDQAEARVHRIGSEASSINSYWLIGENTFDAALVALIEAKREIAEEINQGVEPDKRLKKLAKLDPVRFLKQLFS